MQNFERTLRGIEAEPQIEALLPSARGFIQDRRREPRAAMRPRPATAETRETSTNGRQSKDSVLVSPRDRVKTDIHETLAKKVNLVEASQAHSDSAKLAELRSKIDDIAQQILSENQHKDLTAEEIAQLKDEVVNEALGLGPLEDLMTDPAITEIMVNGPKRVYVERLGKVARRAEARKPVLAARRSA